MTNGAKAPKLMKTVWKDFNFTPNENQKKAILHVNGPIFLPAGPGSGKTRVLLWRTVNLIVTHGVKPEEIFLSTFTEKAALQLTNGLRTLLGAISGKTGKPYDTSKLYVGTVHSLCQRLLSDRRFSTMRRRSKPPILLDELDQYMFLRRNRNWSAIIEAGGPALSNTTINTAFGAGGTSRHKAVTNLISFFNRLSEEMIDPPAARRKTRDPVLLALLKSYETYLGMLKGKNGPQFTDLSLLQRAALDHLQENEQSGNVFRHVIIDEYQDTNPIQERIFFELARGYKNLCVVGDDDQALYRFRGATVENFVDFPQRCRKYFKATPVKVVLSTNYRSQKDIVAFCNRFITHPCCDWEKKPKGAYRVMDKKIVPERKGEAIAVAASSPGAPVDVATEIAALVRQLLDSKKAEDPNQIAFLFPSLKSPHVDRMRQALESVGLQVYAPRAGQFLDVPESTAVFGLFFQVFGQPPHEHTGFQSWLTNVYSEGATLMSQDPYLDRFIEQKRVEVKRMASDYRSLANVLEKKRWSVNDYYDPAVVPSVLAAAPDLSERAKRSLKSKLFARFARDRIKLGRPFTIGYAVTRATSLDWNALDFFYQLGGFKYFKNMYDLAEKGVDEGPACNLSLISQYVARFLDHYPFPISGERLGNGKFLGLFSNYLYILFRRGEPEYEDTQDPFPKGRVPFITVHQSKGLEFPVVVLANPRKDLKVQIIEQMVEPLLTRKGEPLDRMPTFDVMRMFYVALSRAKNLLILSHFRGPGQRLFDAFSDILGNTIPRIPQLKLSTVSFAKLEKQDLPETYSYTGDFLLYEKCPRQYMLFRKYGFVPSRSQTMFFGSLVHETLEDLHQRIIDSRESSR